MKRLKQAMLFMAFCAASFCAGSGVATAVKITNVAPMPSLSKPNDTHVFNVRKRVGFGSNPIMTSSVYYPANTTSSQWANGYIEIEPSLASEASQDVCKAIPKPGSPNEPKFVRVVLDTKTGVDSSGGTTDEYFINVNKVCAQKPLSNRNQPGVNANNAFYGRYELPQFPSSPSVTPGVPDQGLDGETGLYRVDIKVEYVTSNVPDEAGWMRFSVLAGGNHSNVSDRAKVSYGGTGLNIPLLGAKRLNYSNGAGSPATEIAIPFGICASNADDVRRSIRIYDADSGFANTVKAKVYQTNNPNTGEVYPFDPTNDGNPNMYGGLKPVRFSEPQSGEGTMNGNITDNGYTFVPQETNDSNDRVMIVMEDPRATYLLRIYGLDSDNTIVAGIPGKSIFGDEKVCQNWEVKGKSFVDGIESGNVTADPGTTHQFYHTLRNILSDTTSPFEYRVRWTSSTPVGTKLLRQETITLDGRTSTGKLYGNGVDGKFTIPTNAANGTRYCQEIYWNPDKARSSSSATSTQACVTVQRTTAVTVEPFIEIVDNGSGDVEVGTSYTVRTYAKVTNFPLRQDGGLSWSGTQPNNAACGGEGNQQGNEPGDNRCYFDAAFNISCNFSGSGVGNGSSTTAGLVTSRDNFDTQEYCLREYTVPASSVTTIGQNGNLTLSISALTNPTLSPATNGSWLYNDNPSGVPGSQNQHRWRQPGYRYADTASVQSVNLWTFNVRPPVSQPIRYVGKPYIKAYGGDVRAGGGISYDDSCRSIPEANIKTHNNGPNGYTGSGTQYAAFASGVISQFVSGQSNSLAPKGLTFANTEANEYSEYGGGFSSGPCVDYVAPNPTVTAGSTYTESAITVTGRKVVYSDNGDAFIDGNIQYSDGGWTSISQIPVYQLVVRGNIYISSSVRQIDGLFVALPKADGTGGNIYTCYNGGSRPPVVPSSTLAGCQNNQLVVNGSLVAKKVHLQRDCGSKSRSVTNNESTVFAGSVSSSVYTGGRCTSGSTTNAAEVMNFTPDQWMNSGLTQQIQNKYQSIRSLPPVL